MREYAAFFVLIIGLMGIMFAFGLCGVADQQTVTGKLVNVHHIQSDFAGGSTLLTFADGQTVKYERGYEGSFTFNATYSVSYTTNFFGSTNLDVVKILEEKQ